MLTHRQLALAAAITCSLAAPLTAQAVVIDFTGGQAKSWDGSVHTTNNLDLHQDVVSYEENGIRVTFDGGFGIVGDYYSTGAGGFVGNDVLHAHWELGVKSITFTKIDGKAFDLTYFDLTTNSETPGGQSTGEEDSWITASNGATLKLPSSDWGFDKDFNGEQGDGIARLFLSSSFLDITSFTVTSKNAFCFGLDNFYIDQAAPAVPEPGTLVMGAAGLAVAGAMARRQRRPGA